MKHINEFLLDKAHPKADTSLDPMYVFKRLCKGGPGLKQNILKVIDVFDQYLEYKKLNEHVAYVLEIIDEAIDKGYKMNYANSLEEYWENKYGEQESYDEDSKTIRVGTPQGGIVINFVNFYMLSVCTIHIYNETVEMYAASYNDFAHMMSNLKYGIRWELKYKFDNIEKFKKEIKKVIGL